MSAKIRIVLAVIFCFSTFSIFAQQASNTSLYSPLQEETVEFDPNTGSYLFYKLEGGKKSFPYKVLTRDEYNAYKKQQAVREGWLGQRKNRVNQGMGRESLIPSLHVDNEVFGKIFGGNEISITPQGSAEVIFGVNHSYIDNPMIPEDYRSSTNFDLDTRLQFNIDGKIGERLRLQFQYNTEATFDFEQQIKLEYVGDEDDIIQKIEAGHVSMPLPGTLITGGQSLWGVKTDLKFGKLSASALISQQESQTKTILVSGRAQTNNFELQADQYDANRHFFLTQAFRDSYEQSLKNLPLVQSGINITRIEVWVTNRVRRFDNSRDVVAFIDLAEPNRLYDASLRKPNPPRLPSDDANQLFTSMVDRNRVRDANGIAGYLSSIGYSGGTNYERLENARKLEENKDYFLNSELGYISLAVALNFDEVLAVAFEYTANGQPYSVGELSTDGIIAPNALIVKMLKGTKPTPNLPTWDLMMKNIYDLNAFQLDSKNFVLDIYYDDAKAGTDIQHISEGNCKNTPLLRVLGLDNLDFQHDPNPDGVFDFVEGITVQSSRGRIIFPVLEPFGSHLKKKIGDPITADKYIYQELYDSTHIRAREVAEKNRFKLRGSFQSESSNEISLNAMNIPEGSVVVTAGSVLLVENVDYVVNYAMGTVRIINPGYMNSNTPISVSLEDRGLFNVMQKTLYGLHLNYQFNKKFNIGATLMGVHERPLTHKVIFDDDPPSNIMWGLNMSYRTESMLLTRMVDKLPFLKTKVPSQFNFDAEFAQLLPGQSSAAGGKTYVDDFEAAQITLDLRGYMAWHLASAPEEFLGFTSHPQDTLEYGYRRSKFAWYTISTDFVRNTPFTPSYIRENPSLIENHFVREIPVHEIYRQRDIPIGQPNVINTLNIAYYPEIRGPYNYQTSQAKVAPNGKFRNPKEQWGGMMRSLTETDFETANYEYIEFWLMDPFVYDKKSKGGYLYINLGNISEDILKDGFKQFENGLPHPFDANSVIKTAWGYVPKVESLVYAFDNNFAARPNQDVGLDGLKDIDEVAFFGDKFLSKLDFLDNDARAKLEEDPSGDNYRHFFDRRFAEAKASVQDCYADFNGTEGNSRPPEQSGGQNTMATSNPDVEDINKDNTMGEVESYFEYRIPLSPGEWEVGKNFITDSIVGTANFSSGESDVVWYQFKVPLREHSKVVGDIYDFRSIRFMRMFLSGFVDTTYLRFASLELVRSDWRTYENVLVEGKEGSIQPGLSNAKIDISTVNIEENSFRTPVNYLLPPHAIREIDPSTYQVNQMNEQSMQLRVLDLADGEGRAAFRWGMYDFRLFGRLQMDIHAEKLIGQPLKDNEVSLFIRLGSDFKDNYYEYEIPLTLTEHGHYSDDQRLKVWPKENFMDLELQLLTDLKLERNQSIKHTGGSIRDVFEKNHGENRKLRIVGNPSLGTIRTLMIGVRNPAKSALNPGDDGFDKSCIVWVDELRLANANNDGGWAANARVSTTLADFGSIGVSGNIKTAGFGSLESRINDRLKEDIYQYDIVTNFELGKFFSERSGVHIPLFFGFSEYFETPMFNPYDQDVLFKDALNSLVRSERDSLKNLVQTYNRRRAFSLNNVRITPDIGAQKVFSVSNLSLSYSFNENLMRNMRTAVSLQKTYSGVLSYNYSIQPKYIEPFKGIKPKSLALLSSLNINPYPNQVSIVTDMNRYYWEQQNRNLVYPDIPIPATFAKDFMWNRTYAMTYDIARSLKLDFVAVNQARIDEPEGMVDRRKDRAGYREWRDSVWTNIRHFGRNVNYNQQLTVVWTLPINKLPMMDWTSASISYRSAYEWVTAPLLQDGSDYDPGNTISNQQTIMPTANLSFMRLYSKSAYLRGVNDRFNGRAKTNLGFKEVTYQSAKTNFTANRKRVVKHGLGTTDVIIKVYDEENREVRGTTAVQDKHNIAVTFTEDKKNLRVAVVGRVPKSQNPLVFTGELLLKLAMSLQSVNLTYTEQNTTVLPGFKPESRLMGTSTYNGSRAPGWGFVFGKQDINFLEKARGRGWLTQDETFILPYLMTHNEEVRIQANLEPFRDLQIRLSGMRTFNSYETMYSVVNKNGERQQMGRFGISIISLGSAFESPTAGNGFWSEVYQTFLDSRSEIAWMYAGRRTSSSPAYDPGTGLYPDGYSEFSPEVLVAAFQHAYAGRSKNSGLFRNFTDIPMPNWDISYNGLSRIPALKSVIRNATLRHTYLATYFVGSFALNRLYSPEQDGFSYVRNSLGDFIPYRDMLNVSIREEMAPLFQIDLSFQNNLLLNFETRRARTVSLSLPNNQVSEIRNKEHIVGAGYLFNNVPLLFNIDRRGGAAARTQLSLRADFSYREEVNIIRRFNERNDFSQLADGRDILAIKFYADYTISDKVNMRLFYDRILTDPYISAITTKNTNIGLSVRVLFTP